MGATPFDLIAYCQDRGILVEAYSPVAHGSILKDRGVQAIAQRYDVIVPQLCIRYCLQLGLAPLPKTTNPEHMRFNAGLDFEITAGDMDALKDAAPFKDYGEASIFPVFGGKR